MARRQISDFLTGSLGGAGAGAGIAGGLATAGAISAGPAAWGIMGGTALLGGLGSLMEDEDPMAGINRRSGELSNQLMEMQISGMEDEKRRRRKTEKLFGNSMKSFFRGARLPSSAMKLERGY